MLRERLRALAFFTPWVSIPLGLLGVALLPAVLLAAFVPFGWIALPALLTASVALALWLRPRYRLSILDSSPLGVFLWLQRR